MIPQEASKDYEKEMFNRSVEAWAWLNEKLEKIVCNTEETSITLAQCNHYQS